MALAQSKLTAQGQISVPAEIRRKLGLAAGSILEWDQEGDHIIVRRAGRYTSEEVHLALFPKSPKPKTLSDLKEGVRKAVKERHARR
jgi:AbrB family looped-hinge helix DNA binding protein